ncbi:MAG: hypothetical protein ACI92I_000475 [Acidimicrobiales bacterium]|jgi:hypothetical protein
MEPEIENIAESDHEALKELVNKNSVLLEENNRLLKKLHRNALWGFWVRVTWFVVMLGLPFALYFYVLEPYFSALGSNYEVFKAGVNEIPGLKGMGQLLDTITGNN